MCSLLCCFWAQHTNVNILQIFREPVNSGNSGAYSCLWPFWTVGDKEIKRWWKQISHNHVKSNDMCCVARWVWNFQGGSRWSMWQILCARKNQLLNFLRILCTLYILWKWNTLQRGNQANKLTNGLLETAGLPPVAEDSVSLTWWWNSTLCFKSTISPTRLCKLVCIANLVNLGKEQNWTIVSRIHCKKWQITLESVDS